MNGPSLTELYKKYGPNKENGYKTAYLSTRKRWAQTADVEVVHFEVPEDEALQFNHDEHAEGWGSTHLLMLANAGVGSRWFAVNLSGMTEEELDAFKETINLTIEASRETVQHRDIKAQEAFDGSDGKIYERCYRQAPILVDLTRPKPEHPEGLQSGPDLPA